MPDLRGARVGVLDGRRPEEMAGLVRRYGGEPVLAATVREASLDRGDLVGTFAQGLSGGRFEVVIFLTGAGAQALFAEADRLGRLPEVLAGLRRATVVARGPKPSAALRRVGVPVSVGVAEPYTTRELIEAVYGLDLEDRGVALVHYGEHNEEFAAALRSRGARLEELLLYEWLLPEDVGPMRRMVADLIEGRVDAVAFTSQVQARHLFQVARELGQSGELRDALNGRVVVASVAPTCLSALRDLGVEPRVVPEHPKMGHLIRALAEYLGASGEVPPSIEETTRPRRCR